MSFEQSVTQNRLSGDLRDQRSIPGRSTSPPKLRSTIKAFSRSTRRREDIAVRHLPSAVDRTLRERSGLALLRIAVAQSQRDKRVLVGELKATPDSYLPSLTLQVGLEPLIWGRDPGCNVQHSDPFDKRVSRTALWISWRCTENVARRDTKDCASRRGQVRVREGRVVISTWATSGIRVNGVHLAKQSKDGCKLFGYLHDGDTVTMFSDGKEKLKLVWSSHYGRASHQQPFQVFEGRKDFFGSCVKPLRNQGR